MGRTKAILSRSHNECDPSGAKSERGQLLGHLVAKKSVILNDGFCTGVPMYIKAKNKVSRKRTITNPKIVRNERNNV